MNLLNEPTEMMPIPRSILQMLRIILCVVLVLSSQPVSAGNILDDPQLPGKLIQLFRSETSDVSEHQLLMKWLVACGDKDVLKDIEDLLSHESRMMRGHAAFVFAGLGDDRGFHALVDMLNEKRVYDSNAKEKYPSIQLFGRQIRQDRYYAAWLLGPLKDPRAVPILLKYLDDDVLKNIVPWSLSQIGHPDAIGPLINQLKAPKPDARRLAVHALKSMNAQQAFPNLKPLLNDHERTSFDSRRTVAEETQEAIDFLEAGGAKSEMNRLLEGCNPCIPKKEEIKDTLKAELIMGSPYHWTLPDGRIQLDLKLTNVSDRVVEFVTSSYRESDCLCLVNQSGESSKISMRWYSGLLPYARYKLSTGEECKLKTGAIAFIGKNTETETVQHPTPYIFHAEPGIHILRSWVRIAKGSVVFSREEPELMSKDTDLEGWFETDPLRIEILKFPKGLR